jgi:hypothetical protein
MRDRINRGNGRKRALKKPRMTWRIKTSENGIHIERENGEQVAVELSWQAATLILSVVACAAIVACGFVLMHKEQ